jgi:predicted RNA-binding Zn ribbon-like protein
MNALKSLKLDERPAATMKLVGGRLCLDFVNTVGGRKKEEAPKKGKVVSATILDDKLEHYFDLLAWSRHVGLIDENGLRAMAREAAKHEKEARAVLQRAVALREALWRICVATANGERVNAADLDLLNEELDIASEHERLVAADGNFVWEFVRGRNALDQMLWFVVQSAGEMLTTADLTRLRECYGEDCGWLFEDTSRNRSRQWCQMQDCGNRAKVRSFRARQSKPQKK